MEEKKEVKMKVTKGGKEAQGKLTYEQLNDACNQLFLQNQQLTKQLRELSMVNMFKRLDYLFKIVEDKEVLVTYVGEDFIKSCALEIQDALTVKEEAKEK